MSDNTQSNQVTLAVFCDHFTNDINGKASIIGIFEFINFTPIADKMVRFFFICNIKNVRGGKISLLQYRPDETFTNLVNIPTLSEEQQGGHINLAVEVQNPQFPVAGTYSYILTMDDQQIWRSQIEVKLSEGTPQ